MALSTIEPNMPRAIRHDKKEVEAVLHPLLQTLQADTLTRDQGTSQLTELEGRPHFLSLLLEAATIDAGHAGELGLDSDQHAAARLTALVTMKHVMRRGYVHLPAAGRAGIQTALVRTVLDAGSSPKKEQHALFELLRYIGGVEGPSPHLVEPLRAVLSCSQPVAPLLAISALHHFFRGVLDQQHTLGRASSAVPQLCEWAAPIILASASALLPAAISSAPSDPDVASHELHAHLKLAQRMWELSSPPPAALAAELPEWLNIGAACVQRVCSVVEVADPVMLATLDPQMVRRQWAAARRSVKWWRSLLSGMTSRAEAEASLTQQAFLQFGGVSTAWGYLFAAHSMAELCHCMAGLMKVCGSLRCALPWS